MDPTRLWAEVELTVEFFDVDSMQVVWHGNYLKYMERARCALRRACAPANRTSSSASPARTRSSSTRRRPTPLSP